MRRSEINIALAGAIAFFKQNYFPLPPFAYWTPEEWLKKGPEYKETLKVRLGWDVTDFGSNDFPRMGRTIFTLRNGSGAGSVFPKSYAQKVMYLAEGQKSAIHYHKSKMEDIINQGGGNILIRLWKRTPDNRPAEDAFEISLDGCRIKTQGGTVLRLCPGESVCVVPLMFHQFWAEEGTGAVLSMEVSTVCNDAVDNFFFPQGERFPAIIEDEARQYVLCTEYNTIHDSEMVK